VALVGRLEPDEAYPLLLAAWEHPGLRDAVVRELATHPRAADRQKFVAALSSADPLAVQRAADALIQLEINCNGREMAEALKALKQACSDTKRSEPRQTLVRLLNFWTEENSGVDPHDDPQRVWRAWQQLFVDYYPGSAQLLKQGASADTAAWQKRLAGIDWQSGDAARGRGVFQSRTCHRCHEQSGHLGPDLKGAAARLDRNDLFRAIVEPNLEVAPAYQTTVVVTNSGQVYHGLIVYESPETTLLQTDPDTTLRITNTDQSSVRRGTQSLMPTGLLDPLSDRDLSDLYAYLRSLEVK
jgi:putative heme-binding domain-containing protein